MIAFVCIAVFGFALKKAFGTIRPISRERSKIYADVSGRLTESLGGVRVIKGYHAEDREHEVFSGGVQRLLNNVLRTLTATSVMSLSSTVLLGIVGAVVMYLGARQIIAGTLTLGGFFTYTMFMGFLIAPVLQVVNIGTQITEAMAGLERTREVLNERAEDIDPERTIALASIIGKPLPWYPDRGGEEPRMRGDVVYRIYGVHEGREKDTFFGAFRSVAEAEAKIANLQAQEMGGRNWAEQYHNRGFVIREVIVETDFEIPSLPKPRDKYAVNGIKVSPPIVGSARWVSMCRIGGT